MVRGMVNIIRRTNKLARTRDYIMLSGRKWLNGIATRPEVVKQFVAGRLQHLVATPGMGRVMSSNARSRPKSSKVA